MSLEERLNQIIIPDYPTEGLTLAEAVEILRVKSREATRSAAPPFRMGVNIVIVTGGERKLPPASGLGLRDAPLAEALRHVAGLVNLKCTVERHAVTIRDADDQRTPQYRQTTGLQHRLEQIILPKVSFQQATLEEAVEYLRVNRGCLDLSGGEPAVAPWNFVLHLPQGGKRFPISVDLEDIPLGEALRYCAEISDARLRYDPFAVVVTDEETGGSSASLPAPSQLILPAIDLTGATLAESIKFIRLKSRELSPDHREVNIVVTPGSPDASIDLSLKSIPISEALRYISELSGHTLTFDGRSFVLSPKSSR